MQRSHFLIVAAVVPGAFGLVMMVAPDLMLGDSLALLADTATRVVIQWVGFGVLSLAWINFLSRNDVGSPALKAYYASGFMTLSGLVSGLVPHSLLGGGFAY